MYIYTSNTNPMILTRDPKKSIEIKRKKYAYIHIYLSFFKDHKTWTS